MLTFDQARARILETQTVLNVERVPLEAAVGRVLARDVLAHEPMPSFHTSAMDGYALRVQDAGNSAPFAMDVVSEARAGGDDTLALQPGVVHRIFTGAPVPEGADAVIMQEEVTRDGARATFSKLPRVGQNIRRAGSELAQGAVALTAGTRVSAHAIGLAAALGRTWLEVRRAPVVSILTTGDELRDAGDPARNGSLYDSNAPMLAAWVRACGGVARVLPRVPDQLDAVRSALIAARAQSDVVLTVGGVSVGDHDVVRRALEAAEIELSFWRVAIKPGKPLAVGQSGTTRYIGLPGNPASAAVTFVLFVAPLLRAMQGDRGAVAPFVRLPLWDATSHSLGRLEFARASITMRQGELGVSVLSSQSSGAVSNMAWADGLVALPAEQQHFAAGERVEVLRFQDV